MKHKSSLIIALTLAVSLWATGALAAELTDGLVGYWPLDGNGNDESGNGHDAELEKGAKWVDDGWVNGAVEVDGGGGHVAVDNKFELTTDTLTVIARINGWKTIDWSGIVVGRSGTPFWMGVAANNTLTYVWNNNAADTWGWEKASEIPENQWALVAIAISPDKATSYVYHRATDKLDAADNDITHIEQTVINLKFGWDECCGARYFKGIIDEVMVYDRALNAADIERLATVGLAVNSNGKLTTTWAAIKEKTE